MNLFKSKFVLLLYPYFINTVYSETNILNGDPAYDTSFWDTTISNYSLFLEPSIDTSINLKHISSNNDFITHKTYIKPSCQVETFDYEKIHDIFPNDIDKYRRIGCLHPTKNDIASALSPINVKTGTYGPNFVTSEYFNNDTDWNEACGSLCMELNIEYETSGKFEHRCLSYSKITPNGEDNGRFKCQFQRCTVRSDVEISVKTIPNINSEPISRYYFWESGTTYSLHKNTRTAWILSGCGLNILPKYENPIIPSSKPSSSSPTKNPTKASTHTKNPTKISPPTVSQTNLITNQPSTNIVTPPPSIPKTIEDIISYLKINLDSISSKQLNLDIHTELYEIFNVQEHTFIVKLLEKLRLDFNHLDELKEADMLGFTIENLAIYIYSSTIEKVTTESPTLAPKLPLQSTDWIPYNPFHDSTNTNFKNNLEINANCPIRYYNKKSIGGTITCPENELLYKKEFDSSNSWKDVCTYECIKYNMGIYSENNKIPCKSFVKVNSGNNNFNCKLYSCLPSDNTFEEHSSHRTGIFFDKICGIGETFSPTPLPTKKPTNTISEPIPTRNPTNYPTPIKITLPPSTPSLPPITLPPILKQNPTQTPTTNTDTTQNTLAPSKSNTNILSTKYPSNNEKNDEIDDGLSSLAIISVIVSVVFFITVVSLFIYIKIFKKKNTNVNNNINTDIKGKYDYCLHLLFHSLIFPIPIRYQIPMMVHLFHIR